MKLYEKCIPVCTLLVMFLCPQTGHSEGASILVSTGEELAKALSVAMPGDSILLEPGEYSILLQHERVPDGLGNTVERNWFFRADANGTKDRKIRLASADSQKPATLKGNGWNSDGYGLYLTGDNWIVENLHITEAAKGIVIDRAKGVILRNVKIYNIGQEAIHIRDGAHHIMIENSSLKDIGLRNDGYGEGIYIGSDKAVWKEGDGKKLGEKGLLYSRNVHHVFVKSCTLGPNITAEPFDIKEGSSYVLIENCDIYGSGVSGENYADSLIDIKGTNIVIRKNRLYQEDNPKILRGIHVIPRTSAGVPEELTAHSVYVHDNIFYLHAAVPIGQANKGSEKIYMWDNQRVPGEGKSYDSRIIAEKPVQYIEFY
jgi:pectate lyase